MFFNYCYKFVNWIFKMFKFFLDNKFCNNIESIQWFKSIIVCFFIKNIFLFSFWIRPKRYSSNALNQFQIDFSEKRLCHFFWPWLTWQNTLCVKWNYFEQFEIFTGLLALSHQNPIQMAQFWTFTTQYFFCQCFRCYCQHWVSFHFKKYPISIMRSHFIYSQHVSQPWLTLSLAFQKYQTFIHFSNKLKFSWKQVSHHFHIQRSVF